MEKCSCPQRYQIPSYSSHRGRGLRVQKGGRGGTCIDFPTLRFPASLRFFRGWEVLYYASSALLHGRAISSHHLGWGSDVESNSFTSLWCLTQRILHVERKGRWRSRGCNPLSLPSLSLWVSVLQSSMLLGYLDSSSSVTSPLFFNKTKLKGLMGQCCWNTHGVLCNGRVKIIFINP